jgi:hypothetical protein
MTPGPESGHGALLAVTEDPVASPNVFTTIIHLTSSIDIKFTSDTTDITPHNERMSRTLVSPVLKRDVIPVEGNYIHGDEVGYAIHDKIRDFYLANTHVGVQFTGPSGSVGDRYIMSGQFVNWQLMHPVRSGERKFKADFQPSGAMRIDGTLIS